MIKVDRTEEGLPVSVIIPLTRSKRGAFFHQFVLPSIEAMNPIEIIINDYSGSAPEKRNKGFEKSIEKYILFSDDDIIYPIDFLEKMIHALEKNPNKGYAYCGYNGIVMNPITHPMHGNFKIPSLPFDGYRLKQGNYISTMALIRREYFLGFDEKLKRLQDWDLFLTLLERGVEGICVPGVEFMAFFLDEGITSNSNNEHDALAAIREKHKM